MSKQNLSNISTSELIRRLKMSGINPSTVEMNSDRSKLADAGKACADDGKQCFADITFHRENVWKA